MLGPRSSRARSQYERGRMNKTKSVVVSLASLVLISACQANHEHPGTLPSSLTSTTVGINKTAPPGSAPDGMVWVPGGTFMMGCDDCGMPDAAPTHLVTVDGFWMDRTPVTNGEFAKFV